MNAALHWVDVIWLPLAWFVVNKEQRWLALGTIAGCMVMMRLEAELIESTGFSHGMLPFLDSPVYDRGLVVYSVFYVLYLILAYYSPGSRSWVFTAASISIFFMASIVSIFVMVL